MMLFAGAIGEFVSAQTPVETLALAYLFLIGVVLIADGLGRHIPQGPVCFAMAFALAVEIFNLRSRKARGKPVELNNPRARTLKKVIRR